MSRAPTPSFAPTHRWQHRVAGEVVLLDNRDSFVFNLAHRLVEIGAPQVVVVRSDALSIEELLSWHPAAIILSPGPGHPRDAGICVEVVRQCSGTLPILGVCLGHQAIVEAFGGEVVPSGAPVHGMASAVTHDQSGPFQGLASPTPCGRYHALVARTPLPDVLRANAWADGWIMGVTHREHLTWGVQFHPESVLTGRGHAMLATWARAAGLIP